MSEKYNWKCITCGWKMFIDEEYLKIIDIDHPINCGKCGSIFINK